MKRKVLIAGAGQLGSRYLQGLSNVSEAMEIWVFDPSAESLARAEQRWGEMQPDGTHDVVYVSDLESIPKQVDLAIVATTANFRVAVVAQIVSRAEVNYWILEKVLAQSLPALAELQRMLRTKHVWVNTPRHQWSLYRELRKFHCANVPIEARFGGFQGLASNAIHFIDFVCRWNGTKLTQLDISDLKSEWFPAKRDGFYEVDGIIHATFADGSTLELASHKENIGFECHIQMGQDHWQVFESDGMARAGDGRIVKGASEYQSQLTAPTVNAIFADAPCGLPTLAESAQQHTLFLSTLLEHWNQHMSSKLEELPIT